MATYYVDTGGGNAGHTGAIGDPWLTINYAYAQIASDDTIIVNAGAYEENGAGSIGLYLERAINATITANGVVTVTSDGSGATVVTALGLGVTNVTGIIFDAESSKNYCVNASGDDVTFTDCEFRNPLLSVYITFVAPKGVEFVRCVLLDTNGSITHFAHLQISVTTAGNYLKFTDCTLTANTDGSNSELFWVYSASESHEWDLIFDGCTIVAKYTIAFIYKRCSKLRFEFTDNNITINKNNTSGLLYHHSGLTNVVSNFTFTDNTLTSNYKCAGAWIQFYDSAFDVELLVNSNTINLTGADFENSFVVRSHGHSNIEVCDNLITIASEDDYTTIFCDPDSVDIGVCKFNNNTIYQHSGRDYVISLGTELPDYLSGQAVWDATLDNCDGSEIIGNKIYGRNYYDRTYNPSSPGAIQHTIFIGWQRNVTVAYNYINGSRYGIVLKGDSVWTAGGVYGNIIINCTTSILNACYKDIKIYNNTIIATLPFSGTVGYRVSRWLDPDITAEGISYDSSGAGSDFRNNIIYANVDFDLGTESYQMIQWTDGDEGIYTIDYNCLYGIVGTGSIYYAGEYVDGEIFYNYAQLNSVLGWETNGINEDPLFNTNYSIPISSPCTDSGIDLGFPYNYQIHRNYLFPNPELTEQLGNWNMGAVAVCKRSTNNSSGFFNFQS